ACNRHNSVPDQPRFGLPDRFKSPRLSVANVINCFRQRMLILKVQRNSISGHYRLPNSRTYTPATCALYNGPSESGVSCREPGLKIEKCKLQNANCESRWNVASLRFRDSEPVALRASQIPSGALKRGSSRVGLEEWDCSRRHGEDGLPGRRRGPGKTYRNHRCRRRASRLA